MPGPGRATMARMSVALRGSMSRDEFFLWAEAQEERYEFDGFEPVAMTGGSLGHSAIAVNVISQLRNRLRGKPCRALGPDAGVATVGNAVRYPEAVVTCSPYDRKDRIVPNPVIVFEVVSPTSVRTDRVVKVREYGAVSSIRRYVIVEPGAMAVTILYRTVADAVFMEDAKGEGETLVLPEIGIELPVADIYEDVVFT